MSRVNRIKRRLLTLRSNRVQIFHTIFKRLKSELNWHLGRFRGEHCFFPEGIGLHPTRRCNHRCQMCFLWSECSTPTRRDYKESEKDVRFWEHMIDAIRPFRSSIGISGGEPFLYPSIWDLVRYIKKNELACSINTNCFSLQRDAATFVQTKLDLLRISIDGLHQTHDEIRRTSGSFDAIVAGLDLLDRMKKESGSQRPVVEIFYTMTNKNIDQLVDFVKFMERYAIRNVKFIHPLFMSKKEIDDCHAFLQNSLSSSEMPYYDGASVEAILPDPEELIPEVRRVKALKTKTNVLFFPDFNETQMMEYYTDHENFCHKFKSQCRSPWFSLLIYHDGSVEGCPEFRVGNVQDESISVIWNNSKMRSLRTIIRKEGIIPLCHGCCNLFQKV